MNPALPKICPVCGLPQNLCVCAEIGREQQKIKVHVEARRWGKLITIVEGVQGNELNDLAKKLKALCACGGTAKNNKILLQGDQRRKVRDFLVDLGYADRNVEIT